MTLQEFFKNQPYGSKAAMAKKLCVSKTWLSLIIGKKALPSPALAVAIAAYTKDKVNRSSLRPDIFGV
jgi:DNA-binding transcriptional regulator YdaS (Cro superfamily)